MKKTYLVTEDFGIGEINKNVKEGDELEYDDDLKVMTLRGVDYEVRNLGAVIKAQWLVPKDGVLPELDGPLGETEEERMDRRRKERFAQQAKERAENNNIIKADEREVSRIKRRRDTGAIVQEEDPEGFMRALDAEPVVSSKRKFKAEVVEDDSRIVSKTALKSDKEVDQLKQALGQKKAEEGGTKKGIKEFPIYKDHYDADMIEVGKYTDAIMENTLKTWGSLHWTKKADVIKTANKDLLTRLRNVENSEKIIQRIDTRLTEV